MQQNKEASEDRVQVPKTETGVGVGVSPVLGTREPLKVLERQSGLVDLA